MLRAISYLSRSAHSASPLSIIPHLASIKDAANLTQKIPAELAARHAVAARQVDNSRF
jgi:hypothetical protein